MNNLLDKILFCDLKMKTKINYPLKKIEKWFFVLLKDKYKLEITKNALEKQLNNRRREILTLRQKRLFNKPIDNDKEISKKLKQSLIRSSKPFMVETSDIVKIKGRFYSFHENEQFVKYGRRSFWKRNELEIICRNIHNEVISKKTVERKSVSIFNEFIFENEKRNKTLYKGLKSVQLNEFYDVEFVRTICHLEIYRRTFIGNFVDYVIYDRSKKVAYHDKKIENLVLGLKRKLKERRINNNDDFIIDKIVGKEKGFCNIGMLEFCADNNLDINGQITKKELRNIVLNNKEQNKKYRFELNKLGIRI